MARKKKSLIDRVLHGEAESVESSEVESSDEELAEEETETSVKETEPAPAGKTHHAKFDKFKKGNK